MQKTISFVLDDQIKTIDFNTNITPTTTVLNYLRSNPIHKGVKEGCAEGDCGACTVVIGELNADNKIEYKAWDSCLVFLPMLHGKQLITVENLSVKNGHEEVLHPVQQSMVDCNGSQCGYCTPGIIMSLFSLYKNKNNPDKEFIEDALTGNLCRCTGYKPIIEAAAKSCVNNGLDKFNDNEPVIINLLSAIKNQTNSIALDNGKQKYFQPKTLKEALDLKSKLAGAILVNGATDIGLRVTKRHELLEQVIDLSNIKELKKSVVNDQSVEFGSGLSLEDIKNIALEQLPALYESLVVFGSKQIRWKATLGGNLGSASPIGDTLPVLMAYNADIKLQSIEGERTVSMNDFIIGYRQTVRKSNELIASVIIPKHSKNKIVKFYKVSKRKDLDISTVSAGFSIVLNEKLITEITLAYGGMAATTKRAVKAEEFLMGKNWSRENIEKAMELIYNEFTPLTDARSGAEFRRLAAKNLLMKFWTETSNL